jgi:hypothetical protein
MKEPWQMTEEEWNREREAVKPACGFSSKVTHASRSLDIYRANRVQFLSYGVSEWIVSKMTPEDWADPYSDLHWKLNHYVAYADVIEKAREEGKLQ